MSLFGQLNRTHRIMLLVLACLLPGILASAWYLGPGILINLVVASLTAVAVEALVLKLRGQNLMIALDGSAAVTGLLLALAVPPAISPFIVMFGSAFAILFGKQLYGGLGHNLFNPAMVGYAALIVSFPLQMSAWPALIDGLSGATPLDTFKFRDALTIDEIWTLDNGFGRFAGYGWEVINLTFLAGGMLLIYMKAARWEAPVAMLATLFVLAILFYDQGSSMSLGSPAFQLFSGGTMMAAFFVLTDPVSSPDTRPGLLLFGIGVGLLVFIIRSNGAYPDGIAFAVLFMNAATPLFEQLRWSRA